MSYKGALKFLKVFGNKVDRNPNFANNTAFVIKNVIFHVDVSVQCLMNFQDSDIDFRIQNRKRSLDGRL